MTVELEFRREAEAAMHDDAGMVAAWDALLRCAWEFLRAPLGPTLSAERPPA